MKTFTRGLIILYMLAINSNVQLIECLTKRGCTTFDGQNGMPKSFFLIVVFTPYVYLNFN